MTWVFSAGLVMVLALVTAQRARRFTRKAEQDTPPIGDFIDVNGVPVHYIKQGSGPVLLLIHGAGGHIMDFTYEYVARFSSDFTVIAFDRPGHGYTPNLDSPGASLAQQAQLIVDAANTLGIKQAHVLGYSYGGALALHLATYYCDFIKSLVLVSAVSMPWPMPIHINYRLMSKPVFGPALMAFSTAYFGDAYFRDSYATVFNPKSPPQGYLEHVGVNMSVRYKSFVENSRQLNNLRPQIVVQSRLYPKLDMPIELIHGRADSTVPGHIHAQEFIKIVPHAKLRLVDDMGHGTLQLLPDDVEAAVRSAASASPHA
jgi:pimeloyl-ACP methyl ester carboxylesterase